MPPWRQRTANVITCPSGLVGLIRGMRVREEVDYDRVEAQDFYQRGIERLLNASPASASA